MGSKGKLLVLVAIFAAFVLVTATGAFSTVEAQRTADVNVAGDSGALLGLEAGDSGLIQSPNDEVEITLDGNSNAGGVNANAITAVDEPRFLNITNNGNQNVEINIEYTTGTDVDVYFVVSEDDVADNTSGSLDDTNKLSDGDTQLIDTTAKYSLEDNTVTIGSGDKVSVGIIIDTRGANSGVEIIDGDITITAN